MSKMFFKVESLLFGNVLFLLTLNFHNKLVAAAEPVNVNVVAAEYEAEFYREYVNYFHSKQISNALAKLLSILSGNGTKILLDDVPAALDTNVCLKCRAASGVIVNEFKNRTNLDQVGEVLFSLCDLLTELSDSVCRGYVDVYTPTITYILKERKAPFWSTDEICGIIYQENQCGTFDHGHNFNIEVGEPVLKTSKTSNISEMGNLTILHLTDFHYDPLYAEGSASICTDEVCCRNTSVHLNSTTKHTSGKWGDYHVCDSPGYLIENICNQITAHHSNIDLIYYTGDFADHFQWMSSRESVKESIKFVTDLFKNTFGSIPVIPVLGNHDTHPTNLYAPTSITDESLNNDWLYSFVANQWQNWLPEVAVTSLREKGYYSFLFRPNFRIVALNNNVCYTSNLWLLHNLDFLRDQLQWLHKTLKDAETNNEKVHIIGHVPPNCGSCFKPWIQKYISIVNRFSHIISGQFNGHSHYDEFSIFYTQDKPSNSLNVAWNGGSGTSFVGLNSNYRIYYVDVESYEVLDHETWIFNLNEANQTPDVDPKWFKEYSFKKFYGMTDLSPQALSEMVTTKLLNQSNLMEKIWKNKIKNAEIQLAKGCDDRCIYKTFCDIVMCP